MSALTVMHLAARVAWVPVVILAGCQQACGQEQGPAPHLPVLAENVEKTIGGSIVGRIVWGGDLPATVPLDLRDPFLPGTPGRVLAVPENPNGPAVELHNRGIGNAVVFLRGIVPGGGHQEADAPVRVEARHLRFHVLQGDSDSPYGFVRAGQEVQFISRDARYHSIHADGAAFFTLALPDPEHPRVRRLTRPGVVELSSAAGYGWMRAYLFVGEHGYYAGTDRDGGFALNDVPPGRYTLTVWVPRWIPSRRLRSPETGMVTRVEFGPAVERSSEVTVQAARATRVSFNLAARDFTTADADPVIQTTISGP